SLTKCHSVADRGVTRDTFGKGDCFLSPPVYEQFFRPFMSEVKPRSHFEDRLAEHIEAEMAGLDDARVDRPEREFVDTVALDRRERKRLTIISEFWSDGV